MMLLLLQGVRRPNYIFHKISKYFARLESYWGHCDYECISLLIVPNDVLR